MSRSTQSQDSPDVKVERDSSVFYPDEPAQSPASSSRIDSDISFFGKKILPPASPLGIVDDDYHMSHRNRGKVIIFNHEMYADNLELSPRKGTKVDRQRLEETFKKLGFQVRIYNDPTKKDILEKLTREKENHYHYSSDCLVVVVLTHGEEEGRLYAHDNIYTVSELWAPFMAENCPALATKPKIFFIQACRGGSLSRAVPVNMVKLTTDSIKMPDENAGETFSIPNEADILVAYCTYEGRVAYRDTDQGTWYISELCEELDKNARTDDLLTMLTRVNRRVALTKENDSEKQMPSIQSTLTRKIYFNERNKPNSSEVSLQEINSKLDTLLVMHEGFQSLPSEINAVPPESLQNVAMPYSWDNLRIWPGAPAPLDPLPAHEAALRHAKALKMFLKWRNLDDDVQENGKTILTLLSFWEALDSNTRKYAYRKTIAFLHCHAKNWPVMDIMDVPDIGFLGSPASLSSVPSGQIVSRSRKTSSSSSQNKSSQLPRPRPPFK